MEIVVGSSGGPSLVVPAAALTQGTGGSHYLNVVDAPEGPQTRTQVRVLTVIGAHAAVEGDIAEGQLVITGPAP